MQQSARYLSVVLFVLPPHKRQVYELQCPPFLSAILLRSFLSLCFDL